MCLGELFRKRSKECADVAANTSSLPSKEKEEKAAENTAPEESRPVLLTIPLRLGLSEIIPVYFDKLKVSAES